MQKIKIFNHLEPETNVALKSFLSGRGISGFFVPADEVGAGNDGLFSKVLVAFRSDKAIAAEFFWLLYYVFEDGFDVDDLMAYGGRHVYGVIEASNVFSEGDIAAHRAFLNSFVRVPFSSLSPHWHSPIFNMPPETSLFDVKRKFFEPKADIPDSWAQILKKNSVSKIYKIKADLPQVLLSFGATKDPDEYILIIFDERLKFYVGHSWGLNSKNADNAEKAELLNLLENAEPCSFRDLDKAFQHVIISCDWKRTLADVHKNWKKGG